MLFGPTAQGFNDQPRDRECFPSQPRPGHRPSPGPWHPTASPSRPSGVPRPSWHRQNCHPWAQQDLRTLTAVGQTQCHPGTHTGQGGVAEAVVTFVVTFAAYTTTFCFLLFRKVSPIPDKRMLNPVPVTPDSAAAQVVKSKSKCSAWRSGSPCWALLSCRRAV